MEFEEHRLGTLDEVDVNLVEPTTILVEPPENRIYIACDHWPTVPEVVKLTIEAGAGPPKDCRGALLGEPGFPEDRQRVKEALARRGSIIVFECKGHVIYPPELRSYIWYNVIPEVLSATRFRKEAITFAGGGPAESA